MNRRLYALLVGIDNYPGEVPGLQGCKNDVENVKNYLGSHFNHYDLRIETLVNNRAVRGNIIELFRKHLGKAGPNDIVLFHFSGHGSRVIAPKGFDEYEPDNRHESLVCYDSRTGKGLDLADKELAVLFSEVAAAEPHILAVLDCCHSGSGIRDINDFKNTVRFTEENPEPRPLESYLDGYFIEKGTKIPRSKMALMAACDKTEKALEDGRQRGGIFTLNLLKVLGESGNQISYADLFLKTRTAIFKNTGRQNPQLECYEGFNAYGMFLDGTLHTNSHRHRVYYKNNGWFIDCGAIHGIPNDPVKEVKIAVYTPKSQKSAGDAVVPAHSVDVDMQESKIEVEKELDINKEYKGDIITLPLPPLNVYLCGDKEGIRKIKEACKKEYVPMIRFVDQTVPTPYEVRCADGCCRILDRGSNRTIFEIGEYSEENALTILSQLARIERWERTLKLNNPGTRLNPAEVDFIFYEIKAVGKEFKHPTNEIILDYGKKEKEHRGIPYVLKIKNSSPKRLFFTLLYLSPDFGIHSQMPCQRIIYCEKEIILDDGHMLNIPDKTYSEVIDTFLLLVSTEKVEEYLFEQPDIGEEDFRHAVKRKKVRGDWFTKSITVKTVRKGNR